MSGAITELDADLLDRYFTMKAHLQEGRKTKKIRRGIRISLVAACVALVLCAVPTLKLVFGGAHSAAPVSETYRSTEEAHDALGFATLYAGLTFDPEYPGTVAVSYEAVPEENGVRADSENPLQMHIHAVYPNGDTADKVDYYVIFGRDSVEDCLIGGYEEQGLTREIQGITVHCSFIRDGAMHGQARFLYDGDLYVIDVNSSGDAYHLDPYLNPVLQNAQR